MVDKGVSVEKLCIYLLGLPALESDDDNEKHKLLSGVKTQLKEAVTVGNIFEVLLEGCGSFLNYGQLQIVKIKLIHLTS